MKLTSLFIPLILMFSSATYSEECEVRFLTKQLWVLQEAFDNADSREDGYLLSAITWQESSAGLKNYRSDGVHWSMKSYGPFQILLKTAASRLGCNSSKSCKKIKQKLMTDFSFSASLAKEEISYWNNRLQNRNNAISAYNAGNNWRYSKGQEYRKEINEKVSYLKQCVRL